MNRSPNNGGVVRRVSTLILSDRPRFAKQLASIAMLLWLASLPMTAYRLAGDAQATSGIDVLLLGWLGPVNLYFAWFANPLFIWALLRVAAGGYSVGAATFSLLFALDTLRINEVLVNEGGTTSALLGFGWGAVLWALALCLMLMATATASRAGDDPGAPTPLTRDGLFCLSLGLLALVLVATGFHAVMDRVRANADERVRLTGLAFKRWEVCAEPDPRLDAEPFTPDGSVELRIEKDSSTEVPLTWSSGVKRLISWGVPVVQFQGRDYTHHVGRDGAELKSTPTVTPVSAKLDVKGYRSGGKEIFSIVMTSAKDQSTLLNHTWRQERRGRSFCPSLHSYPSVDQQPRKIVTEALRLQGLPKDSRNAERQMLKASAREHAYRNDLPAARSLVPPGVKALHIGRMNNRNCPDGVGLVSPEVLEGQTNASFMVGETAWHPGAIGEDHAWCEPNAVYLYRLSSSSVGTLVDFDVRSLPDFRHIGLYRLEFSGLLPGIEPGTAVLAGVEVRDGRLTVALQSEKSQAAALLEAELPNR